MEIETLRRLAHMSQLTLTPEEEKTLLPQLTEIEESLYRLPPVQKGEFARLSVPMGLSELREDVPEDTHPVARDRRNECGFYTSGKTVEQA